MQMPNVWLGEPRCYARQYLEHGLIYVSAGCRGSNSRSAGGDPVGKAPATLVDLKTAIRFLRHHRAELPGDWDRIISCGWSAGGAMSCLLAVTGDNARFLPYLAENGAFPEESDAVFAAQIYCPIIDLEHADLAYEWMFREDRDGFTPFQTALSDALSRHYTAYFNALALRDPENGDLLTLMPDGRGGSGWAMETIRAAFPEESARWLDAWTAAKEDALAKRVALYNPHTFLGTGEQSSQAKHYRIRVGTCDADTSLSVSMTLARKLQNAACGTVDYALVWDQPHCEADYPGEILKWIDSICPVG